MKSVKKLKIVQIREKTQEYGKDLQVTDARQLYFFSQAAIFKDGMPCQEQFWVILLDVRCKIKSIYMAGQGTDCSCDITPKEIFTAALLAGAHSVIILHNHPSGDVDPSKQDRLVTQRIIEAGQILDIQVLDHIIAGDNRYYSFCDEGLIRP